MPPGEIRDLKEDPNELAGDVLGRVQRLIAAFQDPETPYVVAPNRAWAPLYNNYAHLSRVKEWSAGSEEDER